MAMIPLSRRRCLGLIGMGATALLLDKSSFAAISPDHIITLSFDDGFIKSTLKTVEIYEKYGLSCCINVIATAGRKDFVLPNEYHNWPAGDFSLWNDLKKRGHEVMPHSYKHTNLAEIPLKEAKDLVNLCVDVFTDELEGFRASESVFNLPYNASTPELEKWLKTKFRAIRTHGEAVNPLPFRKQFRLGCTSSGPGNADLHLMETINSFLAGPPGWLVYNTHGLDDEGWGPLSSGFLDELMDKLTARDSVKILPVIKALDTAYN